MPESFQGKSILITGGTGSLGQSLLEYLLQETKIRRVVIFSRDELKQHHLRNKYSNDPRIRWFLGDVRDLERMKRAMKGVDYVIHAAALKQVDTGEYNPMEFIKTNILGSQNVIEAAIDCGVKKVIALSTDKASSPINLYGATKLTADKLFVAANNYSFSSGTIFSVVRYGNVMGSRGSVIPFFQDIAKEGKALPVTDLRMTRFWISIQEASKFVFDSLEMMTGGELYVPKIPSMKIIDLARAIDANITFREIGLRPGEKLHEEMISSDDSRRTIDLGKRFVVMPVVAEWGYTEPIGERVPEGWAFRSDTNENWITVKEMISFIGKQTTK
jgi:UDP-N-acetylglucosamine 4,6-dehydratase